MFTLLRITVAICLIVSLVPVACAQTEKEILFRGIDWELAGEEYVSQLCSSIGITPPSSLELVMRKEEYCHIPVQNGTLHPTANHDFGSYMCFLSTPDGSLNVAGHKVSQWYGFAVPLIVDNTIYDNPSVARFVTWEYVFYSNEADSLIVDLKDKLISIYGDCNSISEDDESIPEAWVWYGANDTCAVLYRQDGAGVRLAYVKTDIGDDISALRRFAGNSDDANIDGL